MPKLPTWGFLLALSLVAVFWDTSAFGERKKPSLALRPPVQTIKKVESAPVTNKIINFKVSPLGLAEMLVHKDTILSLRGDIDFIAGKSIALGPSVIFKRQSQWHDESVAGGTPLSFDESTLEIGWLTSIYLNGQSQEGGFILRPHIYYVTSTGVGSSAEQEEIAPAHIKDGLRSGAEFVYQKILPNGFSFEAGGGFSYFLVPYEVEYANQIKSTPEDRFVPSLTISVGWAF